MLDHYPTHLQPPPFPPPSIRYRAQVAKADPSVLKPELADIVASALAGHKEETLGLRDFCTLLDASVETLATTRGPTAHLFAPDGGRSTSVAEAEAAAAERVQREEEAEMREMTFHPKIDQKSVAIATMLGRDGSKVRGAGPRKARDHTRARMMYNHAGHYTAPFVLVLYCVGSSTCKRRCGENCTTNLRQNFPHLYQVVSYVFDRRL